MCLTYYVNVPHHTSQKTQLVNEKVKSDQFSSKKTNGCLFLKPDDICNYTLWNNEKLLNVEKVVKYSNHCPSKS